MGMQQVEQHRRHQRPGPGGWTAAQPPRLHMRQQPDRIGGATHGAGEGEAQPLQGGGAVHRTFAVLAGLDGDTAAVDEAHAAAGLVGVLTARSTAGDPLNRATPQEFRIGEPDVPEGCGAVAGPVCSPRLIVAHLPDGICRIRITTEPMFSRSEFVPLVLESMLEGELKLIMDLGLVSALHSPSLANLVTIHIALAKREGEMILTGLHERNLKILSITKLDRLFTVKNGV